MASFLEHVEIQEDSIIYGDLLIRDMKEEEQHDLHAWGNRIPITVDMNTLEAYSIPGNYYLRPKLYKLYFVSAGIVNNNIIGAAGLCHKRIVLDHEIYSVFYGIDGIIHPDYRSKGYVSLLSIRNSMKALQEGVKFSATYGSVTASNIPSIRSCEKSNMQRLFQYDRLICNTINWPYYTTTKPETKDIKLIRDYKEAANILRKYFSNFDFFPIDAEEITCNKAFLGTLTIQNGNDFAMISTWDMNYTAQLQNIDNKLCQGYFLFGGYGNIDLLNELLKRIGSWVKQQSIKPAYLVINTNSIYDPLAKAFYNVIPSNNIKGIAYLYYFGKNRKNQKISFAFNQNQYNMIDNQESNENTNEKHIENLFKPSSPLRESLYSFFDPRDNGILLIPRNSIIEKPKEYITSSLINMKSNL